MEDATYASRPSPSFAPPYSSEVEAALATILDQIQLMRAVFGSRLDHLTDEMCQMNTRILGGRYLPFMLALGVHARCIFHSSPRWSHHWHKLKMIALSQHFPSFSYS